LLLSGLTLSQLLLPRVNLVSNSVCQLSFGDIIQPTNVCAQVQPETHIKRQATRQDRPPSLLGEFRTLR
jgi:hypothetical protein